MGLSINDVMMTNVQGGSVGVSGVAMPETLRNGKVTVATAGTAVQLSATSVALVGGVIVKAALGNSGTIYVGDAAVDSSSGFELSAGQEVFVVIDNLNKVHVDASTSAQSVTFIGS